MTRRRKGTISIASAITLGSASPNPIPATKRIETSAAMSGIHAPAAVASPAISMPRMTPGRRPQRSPSGDSRKLPTTSPTTDAVSSRPTALFESPHAFATKGAASAITWMS